MPFYFYQTPHWLRRCYPRRTWRIDTHESILYLTFDDGPHPTATPFVLDTLARFNVKASFFCIGANVVRYPDLYRRICEEGHQVGNHTHHHVNGWKTSTERYLADIDKASQHIKSALFRPPYGRITSNQAAALLQNGPVQQKIIMWDLLSGDFDTRLSGEDCLSICTKRLRPGSIIVMHDSEKAWPRLSVALPLLMEYALQQGYSFAAIE
ncbi:MAG: polysaccharide deacetylase family protein [Sphingomonadales bacterium]|nr:polysaccharide deacetylase family protein [Sphingomonadales bacterium]